MLKINTFKFTASPDEGGWSQVHDFTPDDSLTQQKRGRLIAVISMRPNDENVSLGVDAVALGREIITRFQEEYFKESSLTTYNALKNSVEKISNEFSKDGEVQIAAGVVKNNVLYTAAAGGGRVSIVRKNLLASILNSTKEQSIAASGYPKNSDRVIFATGTFFEIFAEGTLNAAFQKDSVEEALESLAPTMHNISKKGSAGAVVLEFFEVQEQIESIENTKVEEFIATQEKVSFLPKEGALNRLKSKITSSFPSRSLYVKRETPEEVGKRKKVTLVIGVALLLLLIASIFLGLRQKKTQEKENLFSERLNQAQHQLDEAEKIAPLNPTRARELFTQSRETVLGLSSEGIETERLTAMLDTIEQKELEILGERSIQSDLFVDLSLLTEGFDGNNLVYSQGIIYVLDEKSKKIIEVVTDSKRSRVVAGPNDLEGVRSIASYVDILYVEKNDGIYNVSSNDRLIDNKWSSGSLLHAYSGNLYILDQQNSDILRYTRAENGFGTGNSWFPTGINRDLSSAIDWSIDGAIWVLTDKGEVQKFTNGIPQNFSLASVYPDPEKLSQIYTDEDTNNLYLLDSQLGRIFVFDKEGAYIAQYVDEKIKDAKGLSVSEKQGKIIFLTGKTLQSIDIKH